MSVDADRIQESLPYIPMVISRKSHFTWGRMDVSDHEDCFPSLSAPLRIIIGIFLLYRTLGWSIFVGLAAMIASIPLNLHLTAKKRKVSKDQMKNRDARAQLMVSCSLSTPRPVC